VQLEPRDLDEMLGCARGTSRIWRNRAFDRLRVQLEKDGISWEEVTGLLPKAEGDEDEGDALDMEDNADEEEM
jgi:hypothetical protein